MQSYSVILESTAKHWYEPGQPILAQCAFHIETSRLIYRANQMTGSI